MELSRTFFSLRRPTVNRHIFGSSTVSIYFASNGWRPFAIEQLNTALSVPSILSTAWLKKNPRWDDLRGLPGFKELLRKYTSDPE